MSARIKALLLAVVVSCTICIALSVRPRDEDSVRFLKDGFEEQATSFGAAAAEMDECKEPIVDGQPKGEWPELVGKTADEAKAVIQAQAPGFQIQVLGADMMATADYRCNRIRIWLDASNKVARPPRIG